MNDSNSSASHGALRLAPLAACLSLALMLGEGAAAAAPPGVTAMTRVVKNCDDPGDADSLRQVVAASQSGDTVDLGKLPTYCGMAADADVVITLSGTQISTTVGDLTLEGPDAGHGSVTISGGDASRVLYDSGIGELTVTSLTLADGHVEADGEGGGCVWAKTVHLISSTVTGCTLEGAGTYGGGVAAGYVRLDESTVSDNTLNMTGGIFGGGGIAASTLISKYSSISGNVVMGTGLAEGGGAFVSEATDILASTVDNNHISGGRGGGLAAWSSVNIRNSTISTNTADQDALTLEGTNGLSISNSTIAFNHATLDDKPAGISLGTVTTGVTSFQLDSSIVAMNTAGSMNTSSDLYSFHPIADPELAGANNVIMQMDANVTAPPDFVASNMDPKLLPLAFNGGPTRTHVPMHDSPALGGGNPGVLTNDQRGPGYPRSTPSSAGATTDIGAFEYNWLFAGGFD